MKHYFLLSALIIGLLVTNWIDASAKTTKIHPVETSLLQREVTG